MFILKRFLADPMIGPFGGAVRRIAGIVDKFAFFVARRTGFRGGVRIERIPAIAAFPTGHLSTSLIDVSGVFDKVPEIPFRTWNPGG